MVNILVPIRFMHTAFVILYVHAIEVISFGCRSHTGTHMYSTYALLHVLLYESNKIYQTHLLFGFVTISYNFFLHGEIIFNAKSRRTLLWYGIVLQKSCLVGIGHLKEFSQFCIFLSTLSKLTFNKVSNLLSMCAVCRSSYCFCPYLLHSAKSRLNFWRN